MKTSYVSRLLVNFVAASGLAMAKIAIDFGDYCDDTTITVSGTILQANCRGITGDMVCSRLDLNTCILNRSGSLQADPSGQGPHFGQQCINCSNAPTTSGVILNDPTMLHCKCNPGTGAAQANWPTAIIDLNNVVDNDNGYLSCNNLVGSACSSSNSASSSGSSSLVTSLGSGTSSTFTPGKRAEPLRV